MTRLLACLLLLCTMAACHHHHHGLPRVLPCPDKDSASDIGEGNHHHDPCTDEEEE